MPVCFADKPYPCNDKNKDNSYFNKNNDVVEPGRFFNTYNKNNCEKENDEDRWKVLHNLTIPHLLWKLQTDIQQ